MSRRISWFSCGAASAVATKLGSPDLIAYCEVAEEHPDNIRFLMDCENWFEKQIQILGNDKYGRSIYQVFASTRYLVGNGGARCTQELKKRVREAFQRPDDIHIMGYTVEEQDRYDRFIDANNLHCEAPLIDAGLTKPDCLAIVQDAGIDLPTMYKLGYNNNNCRGCVKATGPGYWMAIKRDFPDFFDSMSQMERQLGRSVVQIPMSTVKRRWPDIYEGLGAPPLELESGSHNRWRPQLHELPGDIEPQDDSIDIQCSMFCEMAKGDILG